METQKEKTNFFAKLWKRAKTPVQSKNWFVRLWDYFSMYEKLWLIVIVEVGLILTVFFPESAGIIQLIEMIVLIGGCSCELLLSKQSKWAFIVSFVLYDLGITVIYFTSGLYISALFEIVYWMPMLFISFFFWEKRLDKENSNLVQVRKINWARDVLIFGGVLGLSLGLGAVFTSIGAIAEGLSDYWYLDALANTFSVCNGLFLLLCLREQWFAWYGVCILEAVIWILMGNYVMLLLSFGYLTNSTYGLIKWSIYTKKHPEVNQTPIFKVQAKQPKTLR